MMQKVIVYKKNVLYVLSKHSIVIKLNAHGLLPCVYMVINLKKIGCGKFKKVKLLGFS